MTVISARITAATRQRTRLNLKAKNALDHVKSGVAIYGREVSLKMSKPPDAYPDVGSSYERTERLKRAWEHQADTGRVVETGKGFVYEFEIDVSDGGVTIQRDLSRKSGIRRRYKQPEHYAVKVQGDGHGEGQSEIHAAHGWKLFINVLDRHEYHKQITELLRYFLRK